MGLEDAIVYQQVNNQRQPWYWNRMGTVQVPKKSAPCHTTSTTTFDILLCD